VPSDLPTSPAAVGVEAVADHPASPSTITLLTRARIEQSTVEKSMNALLIDELIGMTPSWAEMIFLSSLPRNLRTHLETGRLAVDAA